MSATFQTLNGDPTKPRAPGLSSPADLAAAATSPAGDPLPGLPALAEPGWDRPRLIEEALLHYVAAYGALRQAHTRTSAERDRLQAWLDKGQRDYDSLKADYLAARAKADAAVPLLVAHVEALVADVGNPGLPNLYRHQYPDAKGFLAWVLDGRDDAQRLSPPDLGRRLVKAMELLGCDCEWPATRTACAAIREADRLQDLLAAAEPEHGEPFGG